MNTIYWSVVTTTSKSNDEEYHGVFKTREFAMKKVNRLAKSMNCEAIAFDHPLYNGEFRKVSQTRVKLSSSNTKPENSAYAWKADRFHAGTDGWKWTGLYYIIEPVGQDN